MTVLGRTILVEDKFLGASICLVFKEHVEIGKAHTRDTQIISLHGPERCLLRLQFFILDNLGKTSVNFTVLSYL